MPLRLDLAESEAKIARARFHFKLLEGEIKALYAKSDPYHVRVTKVDKNGWCSAFLRANDISKYPFGAIVGDIIHNLRSALDYIVTALADRSVPKATLTTKHQFPIFLTEAGYRCRVGTDTSSKKGGPLANISVGLREIWDLQPFHRQPDPEGNPLMLINRLSNADKHRSLLAYVPRISGGSGKWTVEGGNIITLAKLSSLADWQPNQELEVGRVRIVGRPTKVSYEPAITVSIWFRTAAFPAQHGAFEIDGNLLKTFCNHVSMIADSFKAL